MQSMKKRVGVLLGGLSAERDVSLESGRNVVMKLFTSQKYTPIPIFVTGTVNDIQTFIIPIKLLLQDNADEIFRRIKENEINNFQLDNELTCIKNKYSCTISISNIIPISFEGMKNVIDFAFIALHGIPGEDGTIQTIFDGLKIPYNGSSADVAKLTMNKYLTNRKLHQNGINVANQYVVNINKWNDNKYKELTQIEESIKFPMIVKPVDDGSSYGVVLISNEKQLIDYIDVAFMNRKLTDELRNEFGLTKNTYIPFHMDILIEDLITCENANKLIEISCGLITDYSNIDKRYIVFNPSETVTNNNILSLEEKFLSGEGQNLTPANFVDDIERNIKINQDVKNVMTNVATILNIDGYARIDAMVKIFINYIEVWIIEINSLPALTHATCLFHQAAIDGYTPLDLIEKIIDNGFKKFKIN